MLGQSALNALHLLSCQTDGLAPLVSGVGAVLGIDDRGAGLVELGDEAGHLRVVCLVEVALAAGHLVGNERAGAHEFLKDRDGRDLVVAEQDREGTTEAVGLVFFKGEGLALRQGSCLEDEGFAGHAGRFEGLFSGADGISAGGQGTGEVEAHAGEKEHALGGVVDGAVVVFPGLRVPSGAGIEVGAEAGGVKSEPTVGSGKLLSQLDGALDMGRGQLELSVAHEGLAGVALEDGDLRGIGPLANARGQSLKDHSLSLFGLSVLLEDVGEARHGADRGPLHLGADLVFGVEGNAAGLHGAGEVTEDLASIAERVGCGDQLLSAGKILYRDFVGLFGQRTRLSAVVQQGLDARGVGEGVDHLAAAGADGAGDGQESISELDRRGVGLLVFSKGKDQIAEGVSHFGSVAGMGSLSGAQDLAGLGYRVVAGGGNYLTSGRKR